MAEFWEAAFQGKETMWGFEPARSARLASQLFREQAHRDILIPGYGYGRNAKVFLDLGCRVTGIEISQTAIDLGRQYLGDGPQVYRGSVANMPFDKLTYDGIFCHALIHLLDQGERAKLLQDCYRQLRPGGHMVFSAISTGCQSFGMGEEIGPNWFLTPHGVRLYFYSREAVEHEFGSWGLMEFREMDEPAPPPSTSAQVMWLITCQKPLSDSST